MTNQTGEDELKIENPSLCVYFLYLGLNGRDARVNKRISSSILNFSRISIVRQKLLCLKECVTVGIRIQLIEKNDAEVFISMILVLSRSR